MNGSIWRQTAELPRFSRLEGDARCDVAVLGAGLAGILTARALVGRGLRVVVLEASRVASGQTGRTTAKITSQHGMRYDKLITTFDADKAGQYARANEWAVREYAEIVRKERISCDFCETDAYLYSLVNDEPLRREAEAARSLNIDAAFVEKTELPFSIAGAVRFARQAQFHPLKFMQALLPGLTIYEDTRALSADGGRVETERGTVTAENVVFATHYPFVNVPGWYFLRMHQERSYVLALESGWLPKGMYYGADADGLSFREADGLLLVGGGAHRTGENSAGGQYERLYACAREVLPDCREVSRWSAQDCATLDGAPYIGRYSEQTPNWYVMTGFDKWGMSTSMLAARIVSGLILGDSPEWAEIFSPGRFLLSASAKSLATETAQAFKGLAREFLTLPNTSGDALPEGHGGVAEVEGRKTGVYKERGGEKHAVGTRCPHLGCQLSWNPDENSWDCPCHGSRLDCDGALLDGPAQEDIG